MKSPNKLNMTRPEFFDKFIEKYTEDGISAVVPSQVNLIYAIYSVLLESDLHESDIKQVSCDNETVVVKLADKTMVKEVRQRYNKETIRFGFRWYEIKIKTEKTYLYLTLVEIPDPEEEEPQDDVE